MLETWQDSWFEEGSRLIYIVPARAIDAILPLQIEPAPVETTRVFVGRIELITPATQRIVQEALAKSDWAATDPYARFLDPILARLYDRGSIKIEKIQEAQRRNRARCR